MYMKVYGLAVAAMLISVPALAEQQYKLRVDGMTCPFCVATSETALSEIEGVSEVSTDLEAGVLQFCAADGVELTDEQLSQMFEKNGFTYRSKEISAEC